MAIKDSLKNVASDLDTPYQDLKNITAQDCRHVVEDALQMVSDLARRHRITLHADEVAEHLTVQADRVRLRQVLVNLLVNAIKYNRPGGQVAVRAWLDADRQSHIEQTGARLRVRMAWLQAPKSEAA